MFFFLKKGSYPEQPSHFSASQNAQNCVHPSTQSLYRNPALLLSWIEHLRGHSYAQVGIFLLHTADGDFTEHTLSHWSGPSSGKLLWIVCLTRYVIASSSTSTFGVNLFACSRCVVCESIRSYRDVSRCFSHKHLLLLLKDTNTSSFINNLGTFNVWWRNERRRRRRFRLSRIKQKRKQKNERSYLNRPSDWTQCNNYKN